MIDRLEKTIIKLILGTLIIIGAYNIIIFTGVGSFLKAGSAPVWVKTSKSTEKFERAVKINFPMGMKKDEFAARLSFYGFEPGWGRTEGRFTATYKTFLIPCGATWTIFWDHDKKGKLTYLKSKYEKACFSLSQWFSSEMRSP